MTTKNKLWKRFLAMTLCMALVLPCFAGAMAEDDQFVSGTVQDENVLLGAEGAVPENEAEATEEAFV